MCVLLWEYIGARYKLTYGQQKYREEKIESLFKKKIGCYDARRKNGVIESVLWWR